MFKKKEKTEKAPKNKKVYHESRDTCKKICPVVVGGAFWQAPVLVCIRTLPPLTPTRYMKKEIIQLRLNDTNGIENFVKNFAKSLLLMGYQQGSH